MLVISLRACDSYYENGHSVYIYFCQNLMNTSKKISNADASKSNLLDIVLLIRALLSSYY